ncbi:hypothetical protein C0992_004490, partial [Termitomyces sp. T32_za158]
MQAIHQETTGEDIATHVGADVERSKSPWTPSSQVTKVGRGASPEEQLTEPGAAESVVDSFTETKTEVAEAEELRSAEGVPAPAPVTDDVKEISKEVEQPTPQECTTDKEGPFVVVQDEAADLEEAKVADSEAASLGKQTQSLLAEVAPPSTAEVETQHHLEATDSPVQATSDSIYTEVSLSEAIATNLEQTSQAHVLQVEDVNNSFAEAAIPVTDIEVPRLVVDHSKEVSVPSAATIEQISEGPAQHVERPASPWVPSYSVVVQGSPAQEHPNPLEKAVETTVPGASKDVEMEPPIVELPTVLTKNVINTDSRDHETLSVEIAKDEVVAKQIEELPKDSTVTGAPVKLPIVATIAPETLKDPENVIQELTKNPRTSSQPAATQDISTDDAEFNTFSPAPLYQHTNDNQQDTVYQNVSTDKKLDDKGMVAVDVGKTAESTAVNQVREVFPTTEQPAIEQVNESKPSRLTTLNVNTATDGSSASPDTISPAVDRSRLESTGSSRFFPGGWFSPSKTVDESRPFFEVVQGEFTAQKVAAARAPSIDEGPSVAEQSTATQGEANKGPQSKEQKSR